MARRLLLEEELERLGELEHAPASDAVRQALARALAAGSNIVAARAARVAAKRGMKELAPELAPVFDRFMRKPARTDPGCLAKLAVVEALNGFDWGKPEIFVRGVRHVQMEPGYGGPADTADRLRGACAFNLYRTGHPELLFELVTLLHDREPVPRRAAVRVLTELGGESCELLLRMKVLQGDAESNVIAECFAGLIQIAPERSLAFVANYVGADDPDVAEDAALALGASRKQEAFEMLRARREERIDARFKQMLLLPIGLTRCDAAFDFLVEALVEEHIESALAAVKALKLLADTESRRETIRRAVDSRGEPRLARAYEEETGGGAEDGPVRTRSNREEAS